VIRDVEHAFSQDGGLAVLYGNLAPDGCIVKDGGRGPGVLVFLRPPRSCSMSENAAAIGILGGKVQPGHVVIIPLRGTARRTGHAGNAEGHRLLKARARHDLCAHDGRTLLGATSDSRSATSRRRRPPAVRDALIEDGDEIRIDIPARTIELAVADQELGAAPGGDDGAG